MIKTLILEDNDFDLINNALNRLHLSDEIKVLNENDEHNITYDRIRPLLTKHHQNNGFDLLIIDTLLGYDDQRGLDALLRWIKDTKINQNELNFGIIVVTNYTPKEAEGVLGQIAAGLGNSFLGLLPKGEYMSDNFHRLISNGFLVPPFLRGGDKYLNTLFANEKFKQFSEKIEIREEKTEIIYQLGISQIIAVQCAVDELLRVYTNEGTVLGSVVKNGVVKNCRDFFDAYCFDPAIVEEGRRSYRLDLGVQMDENGKEALRNLGEKRILKRLNEQFPVFLCVGKYFAVNPLYLSGSALPRLVEQEYEQDIFRRLNLSYIPPINDNPRANIAYTDPTGEIRGAIPLIFTNVNNVTLRPQYIPLYGRAFENGGNTNGEQRFNNTFFDRSFAFNEICSVKWISLLKQLRLHYKIE